MKKRAWWEQLDHVFASSALLRGLYNRTEVRGIVPSNDLRRPAIRIRFRTHLTGKDPAAVEKLSLVLRANLNSSDSRRLLDSLPIDLDSISFTGKKKHFKKLPIQSKQTWFLFTGNVAYGFFKSRSWPLPLVGWDCTETSNNVNNVIFVTGSSCLIFMVWVGWIADQYQVKL